MPIVTVRTQPAYGLPGAATRSGPYDDRFTGGALAPWWTNPTTNAAGQANVLAFEAAGGFRIGATVANKRVQGIRMAAPAGSFAVLAKLASFGPNTNDIRGGVFVGVAGGRGNVCGPFPQDGQRAAIGVTTISDTADWSSYDGYQGFGGGSISTPAWYRITWNAVAGTLTFEHSADLVSWTAIGSRAAMSQPTEMGLCIYSNSAAVQLTASLNVYQWRVT